MIANAAGFRTDQPAARLQVLVAERRGDKDKKVLGRRPRRRSSDVFPFISKVTER
jgi:hypothetical protein